MYMKDRVGADVKLSGIEFHSEACWSDRELKDLSSKMGCCVGAGHSTEINEVYSLR